MDKVLNNLGAGVKKVIQNIEHQSLDDGLKEVDALFATAEKEMQMITFVSWLDPNEVYRIFNLKAGGRHICELSENETCPVPEDLSSTLKDYEIATDKVHHEALLQPRIVAILLSALDIARFLEPDSSLRSVQLQYRTEISLPCTYQGREVIAGKPDYFIGRTVPNEMESRHLLVVKITKPWEEYNGNHEALAYMAMLHHSRTEMQRKDVSVYGISTDSFTWTFIHMDNKGQVGC